MESQQLQTTEWEQRVGGAVRELRQRAELTQAELSERSNVSLSAVRYLEAGKGSSLATLVRVVRALDRTAWLEQLAPPEPSVSPIALLRERRASEARPRQRVRHGTPRRRAP
jgi:transcriptional regulator with XRE-family HTH domain